MDFYATRNENMSRGQFQNAVGHMFESAVRRSLGMREGTYQASKYRARMTRGRSRGFRPDGVASVGFVPSNPIAISEYGSMSDGATMEASMSFVEVKATEANSISKSYNNYQIAAMIEHMAGVAQEDGEGRRSSLYVVTTSDVNLGRSLIDFATDRNVDLFHGKVEMSDSEYGKVRVENIRHLNPSGNNVPVQSPNGKWVDLDL